MMAWPHIPLKHLVDINRRVLPENTLPGNEFRYVDISMCGRGRLVAEPERMRFSDAPSRARRLVRQGDTLISTVRTYLRAVWTVNVPSDDLVVSTGFAVLSPRDRLDPRFLGWLAQSDAVIEEIVARSVGVSYPAINALEVGELRVATPDLATQRAIADYLDLETARVDAAVAARTKQLDLLRQRVEFDRAAVLQAQGAPLVPLRRVVDLLPGFSYKSEDFRNTPDHARLLRGTNVNVGVLRWDDAVWVNDRVAASTSRFSLAAGDIVLGMDRPVISSGVRLAQVTEADLPALIVQRVARLRARRGLSQAYLYASLKGPALAGHFAPVFTGVSVPHISPSQILSYEIPLPSAAQQHETVQALARSEERGRHYLATGRQQIHLLTERRRSLITAAVTGQLDLPGVAA